MTNKEFSEKVRNAFAETKPSAEFMSGLAAEKKKKRPVRVSIAKIAAVAAVVCVLGGAGVYAASEMNFIDVFGDYVHVSDRELADSLLGTVHGFRYKFSDDAYAMRITGAAGDSRNMMFKAEIYRKDGRPVIDFFEHFTENTDNKLLDMPEDHMIFFANCSSGWNTEINEDGNIEMFCEMNTDSGKINGKKFYAHGSGVYSRELLWKFEEENQLWMSSDLIRKKNTFRTRNNEPTDITDEDVIGLRLDWNFSFTFKQSEKSAMTKVCRDTYNTFEAVTSLLDKSNENEPEEKTYICSPSKIELTPVGGILEYTYLTDAETGEEHLYSRLPLINEKNEIYAEKEDGTRVNIHLMGSSSQTDPSDEIIEVKEKIYYVDNTGEYEEENPYSQMFTDISEFKKLVINGTEYELE